VYVLFPPFCVLPICTHDPDSFDWSIETSPDVGNNAGTGDSNGSKSCAISGLSFGITYYWYVNATDPSGSGHWNNETFVFTMESEPGPWWNSDWSFRKNLTIDHTLVAEDLVNFPVLVNITGDSDLSIDAQDSQLLH